MNYWTMLSVDFANQRNYLDELYKVYPISPNLRRELSKATEKNVRDSFENRNNLKLVEALLSLELFPVKDSYVAYLKRDKTAIARNPQTINRIAGNLFQFGIEDIIEECTKPKETNRQMGPMFKNWIDKGTIGVQIHKNTDSFLNDSNNCVLNISDLEMMKFANFYLGYTRNKGIDFIAKFNKKYIIGEAKFLTDFGGHQNAQFEDAMQTISVKLEKNRMKCEVIKIAILDGVLYIRGNNKMYKYLEEHQCQMVISALVLREFLFSL